MSGVEGWVREFGVEYDVPDAIRKAEGIEDKSWHNDACPSFGRYLQDGDDTHEVSIWVEHPDPDQRDTGAARFAVTYQPWSCPPVPDLSDEVLDGWPVYEGDDPAEALAAFMLLLRLVQAWVAHNAKEAVR